MKKKDPLSKMLDAPMAITSTGVVLFNVTHLDAGPDPVEAVRGLLQEGHEIFAGVVVPRGLRELERDVDHALADVVGRLGARIRLRTMRSHRRPWKPR